MNASQALRTLAQATLTSAVAEYGTTGDLFDLACEDAAAINRVAGLIDSGDIEAAQAYLDSMDTSPREYALEALEAAGALA